MLVILFLSDSHGGRVHDLRIAEATPYPLPAGSGLLQDLGFLAFTLPKVEILMPTKKPRGAELTREQQRANQALHQRRLRIEHVNSRFLSPFGDMTLWNILAFRMVIPYIYLCPCATNLRLWGYIFSVAPETSSIEGGDRFHLDISYDHPCPLVT